MISRIAYPGLTVEQEVDAEEGNRHQPNRKILGPAIVIRNFAKASAQASSVAAFDIRGFRRRCLPARATGA